MFSVAVNYKSSLSLSLYNRSGFYLQAELSIYLVVLQQLAKWWSLWTKFGKWILTFGVSLFVRRKSRFLKFRVYNASGKKASEQFESFVSQLCPVLSWSRVEGGHAVSFSGQLSLIASSNCTSASLGSPWGILLVRHTFLSLHQCWIHPFISDESSPFEMVPFSGTD